mgnify:FL=1
MSTNQNVKNKNPKTWLFFVVLGMLFLMFASTVAPKFNVLVTVFSIVLACACIVLAVCLYIKKWNFRDMFFETEEEIREKEKREAAKQQKTDEDSDSSTEDDEEPYVEEVPEQPDDEDAECEESVEETHEEKGGNAKAWNGYNIGDVFVSVPASCIGNYIGGVADAIKQGKVELAHGLCFFDDGNVVKISLNEMVKFGYKAPIGYKINAKHDTLVALPGKMNYVGNRQFEVEVPDGFILIEKGEHAGEMVPNSMELIKGL